MSEDIRKIIDKVKNFKQFVNEQVENNLPESINIDAELSLLRKLNLEKEKIKSKNT